VPTPDDQDVDLAVGVVPDLFGRGLAVDGRVGRVHELLRDEVAAIGGGHLFGLGDGAAHPFRPWRQHQFGAIGAQQQPALHAHRFGHNQRAFVALGGGHEKPGRCRCCRWSAPG
jgi:hypothetical protein